MASTYERNKGFLADASPDQLAKALIASHQLLAQLEISNLKSADARDIARLKGQLGARKDAQAFASKMLEIEAKFDLAKLKEAAALERQAVKSLTDYEVKFARPYDKIVQEAEAREGRSYASYERKFANVLGTLFQRSTLPSMQFDRTDPRYLKTFEIAVVKADPEGRYFKWTQDPSTKEIRIAGLTTAGEKFIGTPVPGVPGKFDPTTVAGKNLLSNYSEYADKRSRYDQATSKAKLLIQNAEKQRELAESPRLSLEAKKEAFGAYQSLMSEAFDLTMKKNNIADIESVQERVNAATRISDTYQSVRGLIDQLIPTITGRGKASSKMGKYIMDPKFREWAKDHGFESIGSGEQLEDKTWRYYPGGDDKEAVALLRKQMEKGKFDYGFMRGSGTGETVQVTLKDGTTLSGERAKRHATDRGNILRIITPEGDVEFINTEEDTQGDVVILEEAPEKKGLRERLMGRRGVSRKERTAELVEQAARDEADILEDVGMVGDKYLQDVAGRYLTQAEYDMRKAEALQAQRVSRVLAKEVDGKLYVTFGGDAYAVDPKGNLTELQDESEATDVLSAEGDPLTIKRGESARYATSSDIVDNKINFDEFVNTETQPELAKAAEEAAAQELSDEALGVRLTDKPGFVSDPMGERAGAAARTPRTYDLPEDPEEPGDDTPVWTPDQLSPQRRVRYNQEIESMRTVLSEQHPDNPQKQAEMLLAFSRGIRPRYMKWSPDELDKRQRRAYDKRLGELKALIAQIPPAKGKPDQQAMMLSEYMPDFNRSFEKLEPGEKPTMKGVEYVASDIVDEVEEAKPAPEPEPAKGEFSEPTDNEEYNDAKAEYLAAHTAFKTLKAKGFTGEGEKAHAAHDAELERLRKVKITEEKELFRVYTRHNTGADIGPYITFVQKQAPEPKPAPEPAAAAPKSYESLSDALFDLKIASHSSEPGRTWYEQMEGELKLTRTPDEARRMTQELMKKEGMDPKLLPAVPKPQTEALRAMVSTPPSDVADDDFMETAEEAVNVDKQKEYYRDPAASLKALEERRKNKKNSEARP